jgi:hypothetical protein
VSNTLNKTAGTSVLALQSVAASSVLISSALLVPTTFAATMMIRFGRRIATAAGAGVNFRIEGSSRASGDGFWTPLDVFQSDFVAATAQAATGTNNAGQKVITMAVTTGFAAGQIVYIDNTTIGNSEWGRIKSVSGGVSITLEDNLQNAQNAGAATVYNKAEMYASVLDLTAMKQLRLVADGSLFTQAFAVFAEMVTGDSLS